MTKSRNEHHRSNGLNQNQDLTAWRVYMQGEKNNIIWRRIRECFQKYSESTRYLVNKNPSNSQRVETLFANIVRNCTFHAVAANSEECTSSSWEEPLFLAETTSRREPLIRKWYSRRNSVSRLWSDLRAEQEHVYMQPQRAHRTCDTRVISAGVFHGATQTSMSTIVVSERYRHILFRAITPPETGT